MVTQVIQVPLRATTIARADHASLVYLTFANAELLHTGSDGEWRPLQAQCDLVDAAPGRQLPPKLLVLPGCPGGVGWGVQFHGGL